MQLDTVTRRSFRTLFIGMVALGVAVAVLGMWRSVPVAGHAPETSAGQAIGPAAATNHYLRSGLVTVNGDGYLARFSAINAFDTDLEMVLTLYDGAGAVVKSTDGIVGPDKSLVLSYDPSKNVRLRGEVLVVGNAGLLCDGFSPTLEVLTKGTTTKPAFVVDTFWHLDEPA